jgi:subtilisin family serine protease
MKFYFFGFFLLSMLSPNLLEARNSMSLIFSESNYILVPKQHLLHSSSNLILGELLEDYAQMFSLNYLSEFEIGHYTLPFYITTYNNLLKHYKSVSEFYDIEEDKVINLPNFNEEYKVNYILPVKSDPESVPWHLDRIVKKNLPLNNTYNYNTKGSCHQNKNLDINTYIVDTGIDISHNEFGERVEWGANFVDDKNFDCHSHGTHVAGLVGSQKFGVCVDAKMYAVKVLDCRGSGSLSGVIKGIEWVYKQHLEKSKMSNKTVKSVINMSLGGGFSQALNRAVEACVKNNNFYVVVAAGNENQDSCKVSPAGAKNILTVMASDKDDNRAWFSNWGSCANIYSPGVDIESTIPGGKSAVYSGTSMATPIMVGIFNHYLDMYPNNNKMEDMIQLVDKLSTKNTINGYKKQTKNNLVYLNRN